MPLRRLIRTFAQAVDKPSAADLARQLAQLEGTVSDELDDVRSSFQLLLKPVSRAVRASNLMLVPGQAAGFDTTSGDVSVLLGKPDARDAGKLVAVYKRGAANNLVVQAATGTSINGASSLTRSAAGLQLIFCDGVEYWA